jgi:tRNA modification GTPase
LSIILPEYMDSLSDTIFALATPTPTKEGSGIAIIRLSGPDSFQIAASICDPEVDPASIPDRHFHLATLSHAGSIIDRGGILGFRAPKSYTGEDVVELQCHGGLAVIRAIEHALLDLAARPADPGEFTRRAFINGRIDLVQAESIAALVAASGDAARMEAIRQRRGRLSGKLKEIRSGLHDLLGRVEVDFDFADEKIENVSIAQVIDGIDAIHAQIKPLINSYKTGQLLEGIRLAINGRPNVGKSSLLNALLSE